MHHSQSPWNSRLAYYKANLGHHLMSHLEVVWKRTREALQKEEENQLVQFQKKRKENQLVSTNQLLLAKP